MSKKISIIIPCYNEQENIKNVISNLKNELEILNLENYEIIVINDASTDNSLEILKEINDIKIINQTYNKGYGAGLKTGAREAKNEWLLFFDADGQHNPKYIKKFIEILEKQDFDLLAGKRIGYQGPWIRQPGKKLIHWLAKYLLGKDIKDFNCGFRLIKKENFLRFAHLYPDGFSCSTTTIFAFYKEKLNVKFVPIEINKRQGGKSMVQAHDAVTYLMLILRLITLFSPLRIFFPVSLILGLVGLGYLIYDLFWMFNVSEGTIFILITSILIFFFGLIADQISALRREINRK
jgi:glycosyltransferase involved in cell wall biosynthesis